jgi:hypothetical protein
VYGCNPGYLDCTSTTGCETNGNYDANNCGSCGLVCGSANTSAHSCFLGACQFTCSPGFANCDGINADGCNVNTNTDNNNCGTCSHVCGTGTTCTSGVCTSTGCAAPPVGAFPATLAGTTYNGFGSMTFNGCTLLAISGGSDNQIYSIPTASGVVTTLNPHLPSGGGNANSHIFVSTAYQASNNTLYIGSGGDPEAGQIYAFNLTTLATATLVTTIPTINSINGLAFAPVGFGTVGGQLCAVGQGGGQLICVNLSNNAQTVVATLPGTLNSALAFGAGVVYVTDYSSGNIYQTLPNGTSTVLATPGPSDGLAFDSVRGRLYLAQSSSQLLEYVTLSTGVVTNIGSQSFDGGYWPSPLVFDGAGTIYVGLDPIPTQVKAVAAP